MKAQNVINFVIYCWKSWEFWQKALIINIVLQAACWLFAEPYRTYISGVGWTLLIGVFFNWWWKDLLLPKWQKYKEHKNQLLTTIKESENV